MRTALYRIVATAITATVFAACSNPSIPPTSMSSDVLRNPTTLGMLSPAAFEQHAQSPCQIKGFWYFPGSCVLNSVSSAGGKIILKKYKGLALTISVGPFNAQKSADFVAAVGTSSKDITGTFRGRDFVDYGSAPCFSLSTNKKTPCFGKAILYAFFQHPTNPPITLTALPAVVITGKFRGKNCQESLLLYNAQNKPYAWIEVPGIFAVARGKVSFKAYATSLPMPEGSFFAYAFSCE